MAAIVNVRVGLSMQGLQPLFAGDAVEHMPAQRMIDGKLGMIEIIVRGVMHTDRLHDFLRRQIGLRGEGDDFLQRQPIKPQRRAVHAASLA